MKFSTWFPAAALILAAVGLCTPAGAAPPSEVPTVGTGEPSSSLGPARTAAADSAPRSTARPTATSASSSADEQTVSEPHGAIGARWRTEGGAASWLGRATTEEVCASNACYQRFEHGSIVWSTTTPATTLKNGFQDAWFASGALASPWGVPVREESSPAGVSVAEQLFVNGSQDGALYWSSRGTGIHYVNFRGGIGGRWASDGNFRAAGRYGLPTSDEKCGFAQSSCYQDYENGTLVWTPRYGTVRIGGAIRDAWRSDGGLNGAMGVPTTEETSLENGHAARQGFRGSWQDGARYWTDHGTGTHAVNFSGGIGAYWRDHGNFRDHGTDGAATRYGFPTSEETCSAGGCYQTFENGVVDWTSASGSAGAEAGKCSVLNNGRSKYSAQGADRVALALAPRYSAYRKDPVGSHGTLYSCQRDHGVYVQRWKTEAAFGESGFLAPGRRINDAETGKLLPPGVTGNTAGAWSPTGSFSLSDPFGLGNPGAGFSGYHAVGPASRWGGDRNTWYYNRYVENTRLGEPNENMWFYAQRGEYRQGILIDYNKRPDGSAENGEAGFAIMLHTVEHRNVDTVAKYQSWGCIAISPDRMTQFLREGHDGDRMIMGVDSEIIR